MRGNLAAFTSATPTVEVGVALVYRNRDRHPGGLAAEPMRINSDSREVQGNAAMTPRAETWWGEFEAIGRIRKSERWNRTTLRNSERRDYCEGRLERRHGPAYLSRK